MKRRNFLAGAAAIGVPHCLGIPGCQPSTSPAGSNTKKPVIDAHVHWYPPELAELIEKEGAANGLTNIHRNNQGEVVATQPGYHPYNNNTITFRHEMTEVDQILKMMDDRGVHMSAHSDEPPRRMGRACVWHQNGADRQQRYLRPCARRTPNASLPLLRCRCRM